MKKIFTFFFLLVSMNSFSQQVRIVQINGGGGDPGAAYNQDFVELFNSGTSTIDISGWSIQYATATGSTWSEVIMPASTLIPGGRHYLVGLAAGVNGAPLPTPDLTGSFDMDMSSGKVALVNNSILLSGTVCSGSSIIDLVGYGSTASCYEGNPVNTTNIDNTKWIGQVNGGCYNFNDNNADFSIFFYRTPYNSTAPQIFCGVPMLDVADVNTTFMTTALPGGYIQALYLLLGFHLDNYPGNIIITAPTGWEVSLTSNSGFANSISLPFNSSTLNSQEVYARVPISVAGSVSGAITNVGGGASVSINIHGIVLETEPTVQTSNFVATNPTDSTLDISWANGNGNSRLVIVRETAVTGINQPSDGTQYSTNTDIDLAPEVNTGNLGNKVVYSGSGSGPITITGLLPGTSYSISGYEFNGSNGTNNYYLNTGNEISAFTTGSPAVLLQRNFDYIRSPRFMGSGSSSKLPTMFSASLNNLQPNTTYRYYTQAALASELRTYSTGAGDPLLIDYTTNPIVYSYSSSPSLTTAGGYGKFKTDGTGSFRGDFGFIYSSDSRFTPGNHVFPTIALAVDGATQVEARYVLSADATVLEFDGAAGANKGTYIKGTSFATAGSIVCLLSDAGGADANRPISMSLVEQPTLINGSGAAQWGTDFVSGYDHATGSWNTIIPNMNPEGVKVIMAFKPIFTPFNSPYCNTSSNGIWGSTVTTNPSGGLTALQISNTVAPLDVTNCFLVIPISISAFEIQKQGNKVKLNWTTEQEINSKEFIVERSTNSTTWTAIVTIPAAGNSNSRINYTTIDNSPAKGINFYRIRKVDLDNKFAYSTTKSVLFNSTHEILVTPNPARDLVNIYVDNNNKRVSISLVDASGKVVRKLESNQPHVQINTAALARGIYYVKVMNDSDVSVSKLLLQ